MSNRVPSVPGGSTGCLPGKRCVCAHACVCIVSARLHTHARVVVCAETHLCPGLRPLSHPSPGPQRPPSQDLGLCCSHCTKPHLCGWEATLIPPGHLPCSCPDTRASWEHTCSPSGPGCNRPPGGRTQVIPQCGGQAHTCLTRPLSTGRPVNHRPCPTAASAVAVVQLLDEVGAHGSRGAEPRTSPH